MCTARVTWMGLLRCITFVMLAAVMLWSVGTAQAAQHIAQRYANAHTAQAIRDKKIDPGLSPVARARALKMAALQKKQRAQDFVNRVAAGEAAASGKPGKEVAK